MKVLNDYVVWIESGLRPYEEPYWIRAKNKTEARKKVLKEYAKMCKPKISYIELD